MRLTHDSLIRPQKLLQALAVVDTAALGHQQLHSSMSVTDVPDHKAFLPEPLLLQPAERYMPSLFTGSLEMKLHSACSSIEWQCCRCSCGSCIAL